MIHTIQPNRDLLKNFSIFHFSFSWKNQKFKKKINKLIRCMYIKQNPEVFNHPVSEQPVAFEKHGLITLEAALI